jgi:spermidine synthase
MFVIATFASAFLIFLVQPMVGKRILPWFGGAAGVWTLCLAFYQTTLFAGYAYAHFLIRFVKPSLQPIVHAIVFAGALLVLPVLPGESWQPEGAIAPLGSIASMLGANVALPFLMLAATGPLIQAWFARRNPGQAPYRLYAVSNFGSLLALLVYPFVLEPRLSLSATDGLWSVGFALAGVAILGCAVIAARAPVPEASAVRASRQNVAVDPSQIFLWISLAGVAVVLLMGVTNELCIDLASVPFLWIIPLAVYLTTFILCFGAEHDQRRTPWMILVAFPIVLQLVLALGVAPGQAGLFKEVAVSAYVLIAFFVMLLFGICMLLHGELHRLRPASERLTLYYLCISGGGAIGGILVGVVAPRVFNDYDELPLGFALACALLLVSRWTDTRGWLNRHAPKWRWAIATIASLLAVYGFSPQAFAPFEGLMLQERSFFGVLRVLEVGSESTTQRQLLNGSTTHGTQILARPKRPASYFGTHTGIGITLLQERQEEPRNIGIVGLGVGTLAAYGRPGDRIRFYEIDPAVVRIARDESYFTYLSQSKAEVEIIEGDARISMRSELEQGERPLFDVLVIDAFSSDTVPMHLLTAEAFRLYVDSLRPGGLLIIHASSRRLDLASLVARAIVNQGFTALEIRNQTLKRFYSERSVWIVGSRDLQRIEAIERSVQQRAKQAELAAEALRTRRPSEGELRDIPLWTDDYSDLFGVVNSLPVQFEVN